MAGSLLQIPLSREAIVTSEITFRLFQRGDANAFRELNEAWIARYFQVEEPDRIQLGDPEGKILQAGGQIVIFPGGWSAYTGYGGGGVRRLVTDLRRAQRARQPVRP